MEGKREETLKHLSKSKFLKHTQPEFYHGRLYAGDGANAETPAPPEVSWECEWKRRTDSEDTCDWLTASEFTDQANVLEDKVVRLAELLRMSFRTIIYSGAGISTAAGIAPAARSSSNNSSCMSDLTTDADPTITHRALAALRKAGLVKDWIQQNHDGLPQKSGYPQEDVIEVHGSWYDPSNPVVCYAGTMKRDVFSRMKEAKYSADLVLVIGTSLSGLNCDSVALEASNKSLLGDALGCVIINLQQTEKDGVSSLRIFSDTDVVFQKLIDHLGLQVDETILWKEPQVTRVTIPYNRNGVKSERLKCILDISPGQNIRLNPAHNCQGSRQPSLLHVFGNTAQEFQLVCRPPGPGRGTAKGYLPALSGWELDIEGVTLLLGGWWPETCERGNLEMIPVINIDPEMGFLDPETGEWVWNDMDTALKIAKEEELQQKHKQIKQQIDEDNAVINAQTQLDELETDTDEIEEIMKKALSNMNKTQALVNEILGDKGFSKEDER